MSVIKIPYCVWKSIAGCGDVINVSVKETLSNISCGVIQKKNSKPKETEAKVTSSAMQAVSSPAVSCISYGDGKICLDSQPFPRSQSSPTGTQKISIQAKRRAQMAAKHEGQKKRVKEAMAAKHEGQKKRVKEAKQALGHL
ncbi:hypothetical protein NE237_020398 [Protea cynaroides]|uniref:Uncharacterized protein n=1 Tax=Protea cynaroides TaxID=273540 RepID=A0A9Q0H904_9MAGN|nr:hypothetical protein NE237_020398 [Protea cynaroides]